ncbi:MAG: hypothetical protein ABI068_05985 [Ktedonobacterales bacterium]
MLVLLLGTAGCGGDTTIIRQTVVATATPGKATATSIPTATTAPPPGIWCPVVQGQTPLTSNCEIYPSQPQLYTPPQSETILAGAQVGPSIGSGVANRVTEYMRNPWGADVICWTSDNSNNGEVQIIMIAHVGNSQWYSWGDESCGPPSAPDYGNEFFRKASVTVTLFIQPLTSNLDFWDAELLQM